VLEHVNDPAQAVSEILRVLKSDGVGILTFPFYPGNVQTLKRARITQQGVVDFLQPAIYHRAPYKKDGSLVFNDFGWDFVAELEHIGAVVSPLLYWSAYRCHFGHNRFGFLVSKNGDGRRRASPTSDYLRGPNG